MMSKHALRLAVVVASGVLLFGAGRLAATPQASGAISDSAITTAIQAKLFEDPVLKTQDIHVSTQQGVVTLTGTVQTELQRAAVDRIASTQPGVVKVIDSLSVGETAPDTNSGSAQMQYPAPAESDTQNSFSTAGVSQNQVVPPTLTLPAGTLITVRLTQELSSNRNQPGDTFTATLAEPLVVNGWVVMRRGQTVVGHVALVRKGGRVKGVSEMGLELNQITLVNGQQLPIRTRLVEASAGPSHGRDIEAAGTTTGLGAIIGAIAGGGEGAGIGAAAGAAAGVAGVLLTRGRPTVIMPETLLTFRLESGRTISTAESQVAFRPVNREDYPRNELQHRPQRVIVTAPGYGYPPPYWGYYGGPYYPYYFGTGFYGGYPGWGFGYYRGPGFFRGFRDRGDRDWGHGRGGRGFRH
ncbi:MAG: BON domain-containing protein [Acidobacteria bacterium]|nr:BON domain-containing protein [Acidobacteriota bacterium]